MGVTNRNEILYKKPESVSSTESLHIPYSSSETSNSNNVEENAVTTETNAGPSRRRSPSIISYTTRRLQLGRRKLRRMRAIQELEVLKEQHEDSDYDSPDRGGFIITLSGPDAEKVWHEFIEKDEETQAKILEMNTLNVPSSDTDTVPSIKNISRNIRTQMQGLDKFDVLESVEKEIIDFFSQNADNIYFGKGKTPFQRLLIHGVSQYYGLNSNSINGPDRSRIIRVSNTKNKPLLGFVSIVEAIQKSLNAN